MEPGPTASKKETITPSSTIPYLKAIQISARSEPISPSYDPNEFVHFYNKKSHQNFANFDRPEKGRINEFFNSFFEIGYSSTRSCQQQRQKTKKSKKICEKNSSQKSRNPKKSHQIAAFKIEEKLKKNLHCLAVRTEIRTTQIHKIKVMKLQVQEDIQ